MMINTEDLEDLNKRAKNREDFVKKVIETSDRLKNFPVSIDFLSLTRQWNSWYPSSINVEGGCYLFNINDEIIIIDPGFNTLKQIRELGLDIRLVRYIFVTHFHPDHFSDLVALITRLTSNINKLTVFLNSTAYEHFKIYARGSTTFTEINPGQQLELEFKITNIRYQVLVEITKAFHREIGGATRAIGLKFNIIKDDNNRYLVGFMGDTDGLQFYNDYYVKTYNDCSIIVPHIGAFHDKEKKKPNGYKHLYREGIERFLTTLDKRDRCIILGEFGFELATKSEYTKTFSSFIPTGLSYPDLINRIYTFLQEQSSSPKDGPNLQFLGQLYGSMFVSKFADLGLSTINLEVFLAVIHCKTDLENEIISKYKSLTSDEIIKIYRKLFSFLYQNDNISTFKRYIEKKFEDSQLNDLMAHFTSFFQRLLAYLTKEDRYRLLTTILNKLYSFEVESGQINKAYLNKKINIDAIQEYFSYILHKKTFPGLSKKIKNLFRNFEKKGIVLLCFCQFLILLKKKESLSEEDDENDGREIICHYLSQESGIPIIPTHPSYRIIFTQKELKIEGATAGCLEINDSPLSDLNLNWRILKKEEEEEEELIDIVKSKYCVPCEMDREHQRHEAEMAEKQYAKYEMDHIEEVSDEIEETNEMIRDAENILEIFKKIKFIFPETLYNIDSTILLQSINRLLEEDEDRLEDYMLIHPNFLRYPNVKEVVINRLLEKSERELRRFLMDIIIDESLILKVFYKNYEDDIFNDSDLVQVFQNIIANLTIDELLNSINYIKKIKENHRDTRNHPLFQSFKRRFIQLFYPLLIAPMDNLESLRIIKSRTNVFNIIQQLGYPFTLYLNKLRRYVRRIPSE